VERARVGLTKSTTALPPDPIPDQLCQAFRDAVLLYVDWNPALSEPEVQIGDSSHAISAVCALVEKFDDRLPDEIFERLILHIREIRYTLLRQKLVAGHSYAAAGRCFLRLIEDRKRHFLVP
jgi:hypothetical protein